MKQPYESPFTDAQAYYRRLYEQSGNVPLPQKQERMLSSKEWLGVLLLSVLPVIGLILCFVWAFDMHIPKVKRSFARAALLVRLIFAGLVAIAVIIAYAMFDFSLFLRFTL
jgi:NADH:ubiquinone oxidoreductase subunit 3 (subunit A)